MYKRKRFDESWLTQVARDNLKQALQDSVLVILQDLSMWMNLKYAYIISRDGLKLTETIGPEGELGESETYSPDVFFNLAKIMGEYLTGFENETLTHVTVELEDELLFIGATEELFLIASFEGHVARGYMSMKLDKRVSHLKNMLRLHSEKTYYARNKT